MTKKHNKISDVTGKAAALYSPTQDYSIEDYPQLAALMDDSNGIATPSEATPKAALDLLVAQGDVNIQRQYMSEFVDAIVQTADTYINVTPLARWSSADEDIVIADRGRLYGVNKGSTTVKVEILDKSHEINVTVDENYESESNPHNQPRTPKLAGSRQESLDKALKMINVTWTSAKRFLGWKNSNDTEFWFEAGKTYSGIPYTQTDFMVDEDEFIHALSEPDFYTVWANTDGREMARYGNDCSGFISIAWGQERTGTVTMFDAIGTTYKKVGSYNKDNIDAAELKRAYNSLQPGDAVVSKEKTHAFLIVSVNPADQIVEAYEQTPATARVATWKYDKMADGKYVPFTIFDTSSDGWMQENGTWYYYQNGTKLTGWQQIDGQYYYLGTDGAMTTGWQMVSGVYYYMHSTGIMAHSEWIQDKNNGLWYYLHGNGSMAADEWIETRGVWYYVKPAGYMATNEWVDWTGRDGAWYWVLEDGSMFRNGSRVINGVTRHFDADGRCTNP